MMTVTLSGLTLAASIRATALVEGQQIEHFDLEDGLPQTTVSSIVQDTAGFLWIGTFEGVARFDGTRLETVRVGAGTEQARNISALLPDEDGGIWIGTQNAGLFHRGADEEVRHISTADGLPADHVWTLAWGADGSLLIGVDSAMCTLGDDLHCRGAEAGVPPLPVTSLGQTSDGTLWLGSEGAGLWRSADAATFEAATHDGVGFERVQHFAIDATDRLWVATFDAGLVEVGPDGARRWPLAGDESNDLVLRVAAAPDGTIWAGSYGHGLFHVTDSGVSAVATEEGSPNDHVQSIWIDHEQSVWFGTSGGLNRLSASRFKTWRVENGLAGPFVRAVAQDAAGSMWIGMDGAGVDVIRDFRSVDAQRAFAGTSVRALWPGDDGGMWIGAYGRGLAYLRPGEEAVWHTGVPGPASTLIRSLFVDSRGHLWVGTERGGIDRFDGNSWTNVGPAQGLTSSSVRSINEDADGQIWAGTIGGGVFRVSDDRVVGEPLLDGESVFDVAFEAGGGAWVATGTGLRYLRPDRTQITFPAPILNLAIFRVLPDRAGNLWICGNFGVARVAVAAGVPSAVERFDASDGLGSSQCNGATQPAGWLDADGLPWFPTANGVSVVDPDYEPEPPPEPPLAILSYLVDDAPRRVLPGEGIVLEPRERRLQVDYAALTFRDRDALQFRYRMVGLDEQWVMAGARAEAFYNDLPPGSYQLQIQAANVDGRWSPEPAMVTVIQEPWFYETLPFRATMAVLAIVVLVSGVRWRHRELRRQRAVLRSTVRARTAELTASNDALQRSLVELGEAQGRLVQAEKLAALGALVARVAHEVNTPVGNGLMAASHTVTQLQKVSADLPDENAKSRLRGLGSGVSLIQTSLEEVAEIVRRFKRVATQPTAAQRRRFKLYELIMTLIHDHEQSAPTRVAVSCDEALELDSFPGALYEVLRQLLENSAQHAFDTTGGDVRVAAEVVDDQVAISYDDAGPGIPNERQEHLFEPFGRRELEVDGHGLGLNIVFNLVTGVLGGQVEFLGGSRFRLTVPLVAPDRIRAP